MGILKKKKKNKEKKPITFERVVKWFTPVFIIALLVLSGYGTIKSCGFDIGNYKRLEQELTQDFDKNMFLTSNKILQSDKVSLVGKLGPSGAGLPIFINGKISASVFKNQLTLKASRDFQLTDCEMGAFQNELNNDDQSIPVDILEFTIAKNQNNTYNFYCVYEIDLSKLDLGINLDFSKIANVYVRSESEVVCSTNRFEILNNSTQINNLSSENNQLITQIINAIFGYVSDAGVSMIIECIEDLAKKTNSNITILDNSIRFNII